MRRFAFALIALLALAMFARPLLRGEVLNFRDHSDYFQPLRYFTAEELLHGHLPLWNPYNASGEPWLANPQSGVFYPPAWLFLILPFSTAYTLYLTLHVALLGCGAFLLFSRFASARGAFLGSVILMLCGPTLSLLDVSNNLTTFAWIPLVLWCALSDVSPTASGVAMAMSFLAGEPFFAAVGALIFALIRRKQILDTAITAIFLSGIQLLPFVAIVVGSDRAGSVPSEEILRDSMPLSDWWRVAVPVAGVHQQFVPIVYIGMLPSLLALAGVAAAIGNRAARAWLALLIVSVVIATGSHVPLIAQLLTRLPLTVIRYPARVVPLGALAIVALAVIGWDSCVAPALAGDRRPAEAGPTRWLVMAAIALVIVDLVPRIAPLLASSPFNPHPVPYVRAIGRDGKILRLIGDRAQQPGFDRRAWIAGYLNLFDRRFDAWTAAPLVSNGYTRAYEAALSRRDLLDAMSIAYILTSSDTQVVVHRNPTARPMAYWGDSGGKIVRATTLTFTTAAAEVTVDAPSDGMVILTQQDAPGWEVDVDGTRAESERAGVFRAVRVSRGHHAVTWRYHPHSLMFGSALTIIAVARLLLSSSFVKRKWHEKKILRRSDFT